MYNENAFERFLEKITDKEFYESMCPQYKWVTKKVVEEQWDGHEVLADAINAEEKDYFGLMDFYDYYMRYFEEERNMNKIRKMLYESKKRQEEQRGLAKKGSSSRQDTKVAAAD